VKEHPKAAMEIVQTALADELPLPDLAEVRVAVLVPCLDEEATIGHVVRSFREALPAAAVYVYDNGSADRTTSVALAGGAIVRHERLKGKGNVVRRMFADIEADVYLLVDGDDTYDAAAAPRLVRHLWDNQLDMVNGSRSNDREAAYRAGHQTGNLLLTGIVGWVFGARFEDMLSGYKVFSRRFVKSFPALATGFEIETELTVHALQLNMPVAELATRYKERPHGSESKLRTFRDGWRILWTIIRFIKGERPLAFFSSFAAIFSVVSMALAAPIVLTWLETGLVPRFPTAILSTGLMLMAFLSLACGLILDTVTQGRRELKRLHYLALAAPGGACHETRNAPRPLSLA
jgi:glycosyltransferase involved in cell wall biosynthesis